MNTGRYSVSAVIFLIVVSPVVSFGQTLPSGGLGLTKAQWERRHKVTGSHPMGTVYNKSYVVTFINGKVWRIEVRFPPKSGVTESEVRRMGIALIPSDAKLISRYLPENRPETTVLHYTSVWYKNDLHIQWTQFPNEGIVVLIVAKGNNP